MRPAAVLVTLALIGLVLLPATMWAQGGYAGSGVPSLFGNRTMGSPRGPGMGTFGGLGGSSGGGLAGQGQAALMSGSLLTGSERFVRGNQSGRFVGRDATDVAEWFRSRTGGRAGDGLNRGGQFRRGRTAGSQRRRGLDQFGRRRSAGELGRGRQAGVDGVGGGQGRRTVRPELSVAFSYPEQASAQVSANLTPRIRRSVQFLSGIEPEVQLEHRTVTLRGIVASEHDRILAENLAQLEPGVSRVRNELRVATTGRAAQPTGR